MARYDVLIPGGRAAGLCARRTVGREPGSSFGVPRRSGPDCGHNDEGRWPADLLDARWLALAERAADWI
jgi:hypothetical protein